MGSLKRSTTRSTFPSREIAWASDNLVVWSTPAIRRSVIVANPGLGTDEKLSIPFPCLVLIARPGKTERVRLTVHALTGNKAQKLGRKTALYNAPMLNVDESGEFLSNGVLMPKWDDSKLLWKSELALSLSKVARVSHAKVFLDQNLDQYARLSVIEARCALKSFSALSSFPQERLCASGLSLDHYFA